MSPEVINIETEILTCSKNVLIIMGSYININKNEFYDSFLQGYKKN